MQTEKEAKNNQSYFRAKNNKSFLKRFLGRCQTDHKGFKPYRDKNTFSKIPNQFID